MMLLYDLYFLFSLLKKCDARELSFAYRAVNREIAKKMAINPHRWLLSYIKRRIIYRLNNDFKFDLG